MRRTAFLAGLFFCAHAQAAVFMCTDAAGRTFASDRMLPECAGASTRELSASGVTVRTSEHRVSASQERLDALDAERVHAADRLQREARRRDQALLATYKDEAAIERARDRALTDVRASIHSSDVLLATLAKEKATADRELAAGGPKPGILVRRRVDDLDAAIDAEQKTLSGNRAELDRVNQRFDDTLVRFRAASR